jgi:SAM-dependent methyltransferase
MDLNPSTLQSASSDVTVFHQDSTELWPLEEHTLDAVFTSNFLEHLPDKASVAGVLAQAHRCLKQGGSFVAMGPNIKHVPGAYWDFFDHYVPLTELSLSEALTNQGFTVVRQVDKFLPYTMSDGRQYPVWTLRLYLSMPIAWTLFGKQFLVVGHKT